MDKPKCRLCGHKHWGDEHVWPKDDPPITDRILEIADRVPDKEWEKIPGDLSGEPKKKFDRVAYQREYMRKRRAKK